MAMVLVVDHERRPCAPVQPVQPVHPGRARHRLDRGRAAVYRRDPFTLILTAEERAEEGDPLRLKTDPGSKTTGLVVRAAELAHRGQQVKARLEQRRACRHSRRQRHTRYRHTRYRPARFRNRRRSTGWLPPSLESRISNVLTWAERLHPFAPTGARSLELVKFETQSLQHAE